MQRTTIFLTGPQRIALDSLAQASGSPVAQHIRQAIDQYLAKPTSQFLLKQAREENERRSRGVPYPVLRNVEATVFFRLLPAEQQERIRRASTDDEKRALFAQFMEQPAEAEAADAA